MWSSFREVQKSFSNRINGDKRVNGEEKEDEADIDGLEYAGENIWDSVKLSRYSRLELMENELLGLDSARGFTPHGCLFIHPNRRWYKAWVMFVLIWAVYSSFFTPFEFGFFRGLPDNLSSLDIGGQVVFLLDIILQFFVPFRDRNSYKIICNNNSIALRYLKSYFFLDLLSCMPWDSMYKAMGRIEELRYGLWIRLIRVRKVMSFFQKMERNTGINYFATRIAKLIIVELYCTHTAACIFYYLATTLPQEKEGYTWIGSLKLGDYSYSHFRDIDIWKRYTTSMYFAIVTMTTVGYGDIHSVNSREMIFVMVYASFDMILSAYLIGNMTALIVKGSKTERYRDKMADVGKYMSRNMLGKDLQRQIKRYLRLQYEISYTDPNILQDIPISLRAKISETLYKSYIENVPIFQGCSAEFINQIVTQVQEEYFLPEEVVLEQGNAVDQLYFVCDGVLEEVTIEKGTKEKAKDGTKEIMSVLEPNSSFGEISILCNIPQPYTVRVRNKLCRLLRIDKQSFSNILGIYFHDGRKILTNLRPLLEGKKNNLCRKQLESDITIHISKQEAELALRVNSAAYYGDLNQLKSLIRAGADPNKKDYDGRIALHIAASRGYEDMTIFLIQEGADVNAEDNFGSTPLFDAIKNGNDQVASLLTKEGASLKIGNSNWGGFLCRVVAKGEFDLLKRILSNGIDPNSKDDYDHRSPLHVAASLGQYQTAKLLVQAGASVLSRDRQGNTPMDEALFCGNKNLVTLLQEAKMTQLSKFPSFSHDAATDDRLHRKKCTIFPFHPWDPKEGRNHGVVTWIPSTIEELIQTASKQLELQEASTCVLSEDAGKIPDVDMITDGQKLYLISEKK